MTTLTLPGPAQLARDVKYRLPDSPYVFATPRATDERRCAAYAADHYEIAAFYPDTAVALLGPLEAALAAVPGVYRTARIEEGRVTDPTWPIRYAPSHRNQVLALMRDKGTS